MPSHYMTDWISISVNVCDCVLVNEKKLSGNEERKLNMCAFASSDWSSTASPTLHLIRLLKCHGTSHRAHAYYKMSEHQRCYANNRIDCFSG